MAAWCLITGQDVHTYKSLTQLERGEFVDLAMRRR